jgi:hypothetical protein
LLQDQIPASFTAASSQNPATDKPSHTKPIATLRRERFKVRFKAGDFPSQLFEASLQIVPTMIFSFYAKTRGTDAAKLFKLFRANPHSRLRMPNVPDSVV